MAMTEAQSPVLFKNVFQVTFQKLMCHRHCFFLDTHTHSLSFCIGFSQQPDSR